MKTIYDPAYRRLIGRLKQIRQEKQLRQVDAAKQLHRSRKWLGKIESHDLRLDVLCFIRLCQAYGIKGSRLIREMEKEEPSEDDGFSLGILMFMSCQFWALCLVSFGKYHDSAKMRRSTVLIDFIKTFV